MEHKFDNLDDKSVIYFGSNTLIVNQFLDHIYTFLSKSGLVNIRDNMSAAHLGFFSYVDSRLLGKGIDCEVLKPGKNWEKGKLKIKISIEFQSDEPEIEVSENNNSESSLDDIRRKLNQAN